MLTNCTCLRNVYLNFLGHYQTLGNFTLSPWKADNIK